MVKKKGRDDEVVGRTISIVVNTSLMGWYQKAPTLVLDSGTMIMPASDPEMNGAGALFGELPAELTPLGQLHGFHVFGGPESRFLWGLRIRAVRPMSGPELAEQGWEPPALVIELDRGIKLFASHDEEGNRPGTLVGKTKSGKEFHLAPEGPKEWRPGK